MTDPATEPVDPPEDLSSSGERDRSEEADLEESEVDESGRREDLDDVLAAAPGIATELELDAETDGREPTWAAASDDSESAAEADGGDEVTEPDYLGDLQRVTAEFANFRKQTEKRNQDLMARASLRLVEALLPVLDAFDAAALQGVEGVAPIHTQLLSVLDNEGLEVIADVGEPFDPNRHEAVMTEPPEDGDDGTVVAEVLRTGYAWKGRVFRPAMVKVRG